MIKKYTALCLITSIALYADNPPKPNIRDMIIIDKKGTGAMSSMLESNKRLQEEMRQKTDAAIEKHEQEHKAQQKKHDQEHNANLKNHSYSFLARLNENGIKLDKQLSESKEKSDQELAKIKELQELNSSIPTQLIELKLKNKKAKLEKAESLNPYAVGRFAIGGIVTFIGLYMQPKEKINPFYLLVAMIGGPVYCYGALEIYKYLFKNKASKYTEEIKELQTMLALVKPVTEGQEIKTEQPQENNNYSSINDETT